MRLGAIDARLELEYPCIWVYKVIGTSAGAVQAAVLEVIEGVAYTIAESNRSSGGAYVSFNVEVTVTDDEQRVSIYEALRSHDAVRMVL